jgi:hypothetical protein
MNRTQKSAWFGLVVPCFPVGWYFCVATLTQNLLLTIVPIVVFLLIVPVAMYVLIGKKQGLAEVASDERDCMIRSKALLAGFISVFVMLVIMCSVMILASNDAGWVNAYISIPLSVLTFLIAIAAYSAAILIQYGRGGKDG